MPEEVVEAPGPWTHRRVAANGAQFHVAEMGNDNGRRPLVLLLHGFPELWWAWRYQLIALADAGYRVAAMDLRGYGGSDKPPRGYDPFTLVDDVSGVIRTLGESRAVVVGHDWGGFVGWAAAALRPQVVSRLAVLSMPHPISLVAGLRRPGQLRSMAHFLRVQTPIAPERKLAANGGAYVETLLRSWSAPDSKFPDDEAAWRYRSAMQLWPAPHCALEYHRWLVRSLPRRDGQRFARRMRTPVRMPVLSIHGALDPLVLPRTAAESGAHVTGEYRWHLLDDVGHYPHEEAPELVSDVLVGWLGKPGKH